MLGVVATKQSGQAPRQEPQSDILCGQNFPWHRFRQQPELYTTL